MQTILRPIIELGEFINSLLNVETLALLSAVGGIIWKTFKNLRKLLEKQQDELIIQMNKRLDKVEVEVLRLQILDGIDSGRLSKSEVLYFFDKYKQLGGNSFVENKVMEYLDKIEMEDIR